MTSYETVPPDGGPAGPQQYASAEGTSRRWEFGVDRPIRVEIENHGGGTTVESGPEGSVRVDADSGAGREVLDQTRVSLDSDVLRITAPRGQRRWFGASQEVALRVVVPAGSTISAMSESGDLRLGGRLGAADLRTASGEVSVDAVAAGRVRSASGDVRIDTVAGDCRVATASGDVEIGDVGGALVVETASGDLDLGTAGGAVEVSTASGDVRIAEVAGELRARTVSGDLRLRSARGPRVGVTGASGDVEIGVPAGVATWLDLTSAAGDVDSELTDAGEPEPGGPTLEIRVVTASGDIRIRRA